MKRLLCFLRIAAGCLLLAGCGALFGRGGNGDWLEKGTALLGGDVRSGEFVLEGEVYSFPMPLSVWLKKGWHVSDNYGNRDEFELAPFYTSKAFLLSDDRGHSVSVRVYNDSADFCGVKECMVYELYIRAADLDMVLPGGISSASGPDDVKAAYGDPEYTADTTDGSYQPYYSFEKDGRKCYAVFQMFEEADEKTPLPLAVYMIQGDSDNLDWDSVEVTSDTCVYYVDAAMRAGFHGEWREYVSMGIDTEEGARELYGSEVCYYAEALMDHVGVDADEADEETVAAFDRIAGRVLGQTRWEIIGAALDDRTLKGRLQIRIYPTDFVELIKLPVEEAEASFREKYAKADFDDEDAGRKRELASERAKGILEAMESKVDEAQAVEGVVKQYALDCSNGILSPADWLEIDQVIMGMGK